MGTLGAYAGIGAGYATSNTSAKAKAEGATLTEDIDLTSGFVLPVNVGLEVYMGRHHNASLNFRIPTIATTLTTTTPATQGQSSTTTKTQTRNLIITLGYSYTF